MLAQRRAKLDGATGEENANIIYADAFRGKNKEQRDETVYEWFEQKNVKTGVYKDWQEKNHAQVKTAAGTIMSDADIRDKMTGHVSLKVGCGMWISKLLGLKPKYEKRNWDERARRASLSSHDEAPPLPPDTYMPGTFGSDLAPPPVMLENQLQARTYALTYIEAPYDPLSKDDHIAVPSHPMARGKSMKKTASIRPSAIQRTQSSNDAQRLTKATSMRPGSIRASSIRASSIRASTGGRAPGASFAGLGIEEEEEEWQDLKSMTPTVGGETKGVLGKVHETLGIN
eukprot:CAMPEP_0171997480 /NCGR_PEP_ID=MMETSP1041-20130122/713_1 /TAXON_ID=464988 /ORGANISM="Hemiselmis andersenii, Strain CCMP439" /LENGTH=285 /DNA_ID=CAMNT_0012650765 /DNA_START=83 /DNA_END=937 /DNA_ORIENTATION=-